MDADQIDRPGSTTKGLSDEALIKLARTGDIESGNLLFARHRAELLGIAASAAWKYSLPKDMAQDLLQEAYLIAWRKLDTLKSPFLFVPWVKRIIGNVARNFRRIVVPPDTSGPPEDIDSQAITSPDTMALTLDHQDLTRLVAALHESSEGLEEPLRRVANILLERFWEDEWTSLDDIVAASAIPRASVDRYRQLIREHFKPICRKWGFDPPV